MAKPVSYTVMPGKEGDTVLRELFEMLCAKSFRRGRVVLSSGRVSDFYIDCRQTALHARGHVLVGRALYGAIREHFPEAIGVGGPTLGADPLVSAVSVISALEGDVHLHGFLVRKEPKGHGAGNFIEGLGNLPAGSPVIVVEDVITTGGSILGAAEKASAAGLKVVGLAALVDRQEGGREAIEAAGHRLVCLFKKEDFFDRCA